MAPTLSEQELQEIIDLLTSPNDSVFQHTSWGSQAPVYFALPSIPPETRFWILTNLSVTGTMTYAIGQNLSSPPTDAIRTLGPGGSIPRYVNPGGLPGITLFPPTGVTDAGYEAEFWWYNPTKSAKPRKVA